MTSLSPFENLEIIRGRTKRYVTGKNLTRLTTNWFAFPKAVIKSFSISLFLLLSHRVVSGRGSRSVILPNLNIEYLGLRSMKEISDGDVVIIRNKNLCYTDKSHWEELFKSKSQTVNIEGNADAATCGKLKLDPSEIHLWLFFLLSTIKKLDNYAGKILC